jgi:hypothetical protein
MNRSRFVSCAPGGSLLQILPEAVGRRWFSQVLWIFQPDFIFTATSHQDQKTGNNLSAAKFFEGKFCGGKLKPKKTSKKGRHRRQTNE